MKWLKVVLWRFIITAAFVRAKTPDGITQHIMVTKVEGDNVTTDINHPLAGVEFNFYVKIESVQSTTKEELGHGHTHEGGGHSH